MLDARAAIKPQPNEFDDHFLDVVGNEFKFDHAKGLSEWLKNSADAYSTTARVKDADQVIVLRFAQMNPKKNSVFECIDFVGMTKENIDKALKIWGLPTAAKKGTNLKTFGGHGNGGKFYMRQMFKSSRFITFRDGRLNVFGFDEQRRYGYAKGLENLAMSLSEALVFAEIDDLEIPRIIQQRWKKSARAAGFTVVRGERPDRFSGRSTVVSVLDRLRTHPQARRVLTHKQVIAVKRGDPWGQRLTLPSIAPRQGFEKPRVIQLPKKFSHNGESFEFKTSKYPEARLVLRTSDQPLSRSTELSALNAIDILGEIGCIGSYRMHELGFIRFGPETDFIYGECECPLLEDKALDCVRNDREKLVPNGLTAALLEWVRQQVDSLAEEMAERRREERKSRDLRESSLFNQWLDRWKNKFMARLTAEIFGGAGVGDTFGAAGQGAGSGHAEGDGGGGGGEGGGSGEGDGRGGDGSGRGGGSGDTPRRGPRFPRVLLSGYDRDPLDEHAAEPFQCDERHPPIYQRAEDIAHGVYWINTSRPLADRIMERYGASHPRWREYLFQRYVDIILKHAVYELGKKDPQLSPDKIDTLIDDVTSRVHDAAAQDLDGFLFDENLTGAPAGASA